MKIFLLTLIFIGLINSSYAQFGEQLIISQEAMWARNVFAADVDGDLDLDILSASESDNKIAWYENLDGLGTFGPQQIITNTLVASVDVFGVDLDGDTDIDVLAASKGFSSGEGKIVWFQNLDGQGTFDIEIQISDQTQGAVSVFAADLDGDTDMDVLSASFEDNSISLFENTNGLGAFGSRQIITNSALSTRDVVAADMDGDLDLDVLTISTGGDQVLWFPNLDGQGTFGNAQIISNDTDGPLSVFAADLDGDNDLDVISNCPAINIIYWYENLDGLGNFGEKKIVSQNLISPQTIFVADLDNDLDMDILSGSGIDDNIVWYKNLDGLGNFSSEIIISTETDWASSVIASDIDNDSFLDVLSASRVDNKIAWYRNSGVFGVEDFLARAITVYPNPTQDSLAIKAKDISITKVEVSDLLGRRLLSVNGNVNSLDVSLLQSGVLFVKVYTTQGAIVKKVVKM
ncbi:MAG: T9SS type A sorting domain-containing protein [Flavobacteriaceae bacterium]|nr:T9SS type A sorting domain-containing protein [Flavobacteriaceae bacterium]